MDRFSREELAHIKAALIIMRDIDAANSTVDGDECDEGAQFSAELILKIEQMGG